MGAFYFIFCLVAFLMQLVTVAWIGRCFPQIGVKWPLLIVIFFSAVMLAGFTLTRTHQAGAFWSALYYFSYTYFGLVFLAFTFCTGFLILNQILTLCHVPTGCMGPASFITLGVVFVLSFWGGFSTPKIKKVAVQIPGAPPMKMALLADTHLGMGVSLKRLDKAMTRIEAQNPDALLVLGDIFEYGPHRGKYAARIRQTRTPLGSVGVLGNHEYYVGYGDSKQFFKEAGITLLENTAVTLPNGVQVAGLKDIRTARVSAEQVAHLLDGLNPTQPIILLSHTPSLENTAAVHGADLMLSGHTHNGQLWPFNYLVKLVFPHIYGLYEIGKMKLYVTSGVFYWGIPLRFLAPAEIVMIEVNQ